MSALALDLKTLCGKRSVNFIVAVGENATRVVVGGSVSVNCNVCYCQGS